MSLLLKWVQVEAMSTPWWCVWPSRQTGKADRRGLRGPIDAHSGTANSKGSGKRIEFLGHFCCPIMWPVYFIKTKILIQSNSSGLASIAQNRIFTSWQDSLRRELIQKLAHGRKHSTVDSFWASRATFEGELRGIHRSTGKAKQPFWNTCFFWEGTAGRHEVLGRFLTEPNKGTSRMQGLNRIPKLQSV